uniref:Uncharacterized protein n=1 Tax=Tanacetum cinerariifolium TaxID=118510 RepID=A0A699JE62_TANCI|nr:hypothetical protein [Tanacetum cinerariifolium]
MQLLELIDIYTKLLDNVTILENELTSTKAVYNKALITLTKRVNKLEKKLKHKRKRVVIDSLEDKEASLDHEDSPKQRRMIEEINENENVNLVQISKQGEAHETAGHRMDFSTANKGKAIMQECKSPNKIKKKEMMQISLDEEIAQSDEARLDQENLVQAEQWDNVQGQIQSDEDLAQRMLEEERASLSIKERSRMLTYFIDKRKKMLVVKRTEEKRNKSPTQAQQRTYISNYVKEEFVQEEDVVAKQAKKESSKKAGGRWKRKTSKSREDKDKRQKKQDNPKKLPLWTMWKLFLILKK